MEKEKNIIKTDNDSVKEEIVEKFSNTFPRTTIEMLEQTLQIA